MQHFSGMIFAEADAQRKQILAQAEQECAAIRETFETDCLERAYQTIQKKIAGMQKASNETVARMQLESRQKLLSEREQVVETVFLEVKARIAAYQSTEAYRALLFETICKGMAETGAGAGAVVYLDHTDAGLVDAVKAEFPGAVVKLLPADDAVLGGARVYAPESRALADNTLALRLAEERRRFLQTSGLSL